MSGLLGGAFTPGTYGIPAPQTPSDPSAGVGATNQYIGPPGQEYPQAQSPQSFMTSFLPWLMDNYKPPTGTTGEAGALGTTSGGGFDMEALMKQFTDSPMGAPFGTQGGMPGGAPNGPPGSQAVPPGIPGANVGYGMNALGGAASTPTLPGQPNPMWQGVDGQGNPMFGQNQNPLAGGGWGGPG